MIALRGKKNHLKNSEKPAKRKKRKATIRREAALSSITSRLATAHAFQAPLYECWERDGLFEPDAGMGTVVVTRKTPGNQILMATFLVDVYCLGVKDAQCVLMGENEYRLRLEQMGEYQNLVRAAPACAKKLVEDAEGYAENLGFFPHRDYGFAKRILEGIEKDECPRSFTFGRDGKPFYMAGPSDSAQFAESVVETLTAKLGPDGFHFLVPVKGI